MEEEFYSRDHVLTAAEELICWYESGDLIVTNRLLDRFGSKYFPRAIGFYKDYFSLDDERTRYFSIGLVRNLCAYETLIGNREIADIFHYKYLEAVPAIERPNIIYYTEKLFYEEVGVDVFIRDYLFLGHQIDPEVLDIMGEQGSDLN